MVIGSLGACLVVSGPSGVFPPASKETYAKPEGTPKATHVHNYDDLEIPGLIFCEGSKAILGMIPMISYILL